MADSKNYATEEQLAYASLLDKGMKLGMVILFVSFAIYVFGVFTPYVPVKDLPHYWTMPVSQYLAETHAPHGWGWLSLINRGDFANFIGIAFLSAVTIFCYARIVPILIRKGDKVYAILAICEVLVLVLAASGVLKSGGH